jgi:hypothetical protein
MAIKSAAGGVDTWAPAWRVPVDSPAWQLLDAVPSVPSAKGGKLFAERIGDHRVMFWPQWGLLKAEGHPVPGGLAPAAALPAALDRLVGALDVAGIPVPSGPRRFRRHRESHGFAGFRRLDLTVDLCTDHAHEGQELLSAWEVAARSSGRFAPRYHRPGMPGDTVYMAGASGVESRCYDRGVKSGTAPPGRLIRPEAQWLFRDLSSPLEEEAADPQWLRERFAKRFGPSFRGRIVVGNMSDLGRKLDAEVRKGELTAAEARRIAGYIVMEPWGLSGVPQRTRERLSAEARRFGFRLKDGILEPIEVDLGSVLEEAERLDLWESGAVGVVPAPDEEDEGLRRRVREQLDAHPNRPRREWGQPPPPGAELPPVAKRTDAHWRDGASGRKTRGPAKPS